MRFPDPRIALLPLFLWTLTGGLSSCGPAGSPMERTDRAPVVPVKVEIRGDGLAYLPGSNEPFTGDTLEPHPDMPWKVKFRESWKDGKRHGEKVELYKSGTPKHLRRYENGVPKSAAIYHRNGQLKVNVPHLNAQDKGEGSYSRWYEDGTLESTSDLDSEERWHNDFKEWDRKGQLKTHHFYQNGILQKILFETPESKAAREEKGIYPPKSTAP